MSGATRRPSTASGPLFDVRNFGSAGKGIVADDMAAIAAAGDAAEAAGGGVVFLPPTAQGYLLKRSTPGVQVSGGIVMRPNVYWRGAGTKLYMTDNTPFFRGAHAFGTTATITANVAAADTTFTVNASAQFTIGQKVFVRLGTAPYDAAEPDWWFYTEVTAIPDATHVTLQHPACYDMTVASTTAINRTIQPITKLFENWGVDGFDLINDLRPGANAEQGISIQGGLHGTVDNVTGENTGSSILLVQFVDGLSVGSIAIRKNLKQGGASSKGRGLSLSESRNVFVATADLRDCEGTFVLAEGRCEACRIGTLLIQNTFPGRANTSTGEAAITTLGKSELRVGSMIVTGNTLPVHATGGTSGNSVRIGASRFYTATEPSIPDLRVFDELLGVRGSIYGAIKTYSKQFALAPNLSGSALPLPPGLIRRIRIFASTKTGVTNLWLSDGTENYADVISQLVAGQIVTISGVSESSLGVSWNRREPKRLLISTGATATSGYLTVKIDYYEAVGTDTNADEARTDVALGGAPDVQVFTSSGTWNKPSTATTVDVLCIAAGGGGGSGRRTPSGTAAAGGGGGGAAGYTRARFAAASLPASVAVTVGAGGAGGPAVTTDGTNGSAGSNGGQTVFGTSPNYYVMAAAGGGGGGGTTSAGTAGTAGNGERGGASGAAATTGAGATPSTSGGASGGGSGGGLATTPAAVAGGGGGPVVHVGSGFVAQGSAGSAPGGAGGNAVQATDASIPFPGAGGGGGASATAAAGGAGGTGGRYGAGGGGGGASLDTFASGAGGAGGAGICVVTSW